MANIFANIPRELTTELFEDIVKNDAVQIERIVSKGHISPESGWYEQQQNEWVILLKGHAIILFENQNKVHLKPGDYVEIQALQKHKVSWTDPDNETIWLAVHY
ncbi:cupin [Psychromonas sp. MB-3u-54]|uniref:cupin domain-containing protein n=1 Tax=Psychromonas sp. MB-3u-54 TaxID=2058319 RepID=UPI000C332101|nr:cupin domain-containing protein [Psychromonas sp. MB-3u-54]PKH02707.1 cupin [Psychromonas sp. MB-3u-54]